MEPRKAAQMLLDVETGPEDGFMERWMIIDRMGKDPAFLDLVLPEFHLLNESK